MKFLAHSRKKRRLPLIQNFSGIYPRLKRFYGANNPRYQQAQMQLDLELRATRIYTLLMKNWSGAWRNRDFYQDMEAGD
jgi:hypothetical protein